MKSSAPRALEKCFLIIWWRSAMWSGGSSLSAAVCTPAAPCALEQ
jgi:hypothetical protein